jgi:hypothetical protein
LVGEIWQHKIIHTVSVFLILFFGMLVFVCIANVPKVGVYFLFKIVSCVVLGYSLGAVIMNRRMAGFRQCVGKSCAVLDN